MFSSASKESKLQDAVFNLRYSAKQISRLSAKSEKEAEQQKGKVKKALETKNIDVARIHAENAIRKHNESVNYLRMSSRLDAVESRIQSAIHMNQAIKDIGGVSKELEKAMKSMDLIKIEKVMSKFESQFEDLDVRSSTMENAMGNAITLSAPEDQVSQLLNQVAAANGLEVSTALDQAQVPTGSVAAELKPEEEDALSRRLAALRE